MISALDKAMRLLGVRGYSKSDLVAKLRKSGYGAMESNQAVEECCRRGYVNDQLLAEDYTRSRFSRGCGSLLIKKKLRQAGIDEEYINQAVSEDQTMEEEAAQTALEMKLRTLTRETDLRKKREKIFRFMVSRGFKPQMIIPMLEQVTVSDT